jgi:hypothetical protein
VLFLLALPFWALEFARLNDGLFPRPSFLLPASSVPFGASFSGIWTVSGRLLVVGFLSLRWAV